MIRCFTKTDNETKLVIWLLQVQKLSTTPTLDTFLQYEPHGTVLIFGAWNYPFHLTMYPFMNALAAGNTVLLKMPEMAPNTSKLMKKLIEKYLDNRCYHAIIGGVDVSTTLLSLKFDVIFFTGSTRIGKIVYQAAAKFCTPCALELGGKNPVYIDDSADLLMTMRRILFGKMNAGQLCAAPDYILCTKDVQEEVVKKARVVLKEFYGDDPLKSEYMTGIVNQHHFDRLTKMLDGCTPAVGGRVLKEKRIIEPTIVTNADPDGPLMKDEIFGPIIPIVVVKDVQEAVDFINKRPKSLQLYVFTTNSEVVQKFLNETSSGSLGINDTVMTMVAVTLPFGGVGESGFGAYHGQAGFECFSNPKKVS